ncbi:Plant intracellular Ras-group-related LRR protein 2 [Symbiodinium microadriaticum]|uniref:Plant intracellular Ras-group-related LRR protein 2 n=1 Tax=Symbiodinium microadriaticum TaxID=2951 RepID=A0A1Q9ELF8_SYMMI|nr:Plant intracellular Ras-group-related LRR protein 2 [Symbiodinium microadriaticum]
MSKDGIREFFQLRFTGDGNMELAKHMLIEGHMRSLQRLDVSFNDLQVLPPLDRNIELVELDVSYNQLAELPDLSQQPGEGRESGEVNEICVQDNQIQELPDFRGYALLRTLACSGNPLRKLPPNPSSCDCCEAFNAWLLESLSFCEADFRGSGLVDTRGTDLHDLGYEAEMPPLPTARGEVRGKCLNFAPQSRDLSTARRHLDQFLEAVVAAAAPLRASQESAGSVGCNGYSKSIGPKRGRKADYFHGGQPKASIIGIRRPWLASGRGLALVLRCSASSQAKLLEEAREKLASFEQQLCHSVDLEVITVPHQQKKSSRDAEWQAEGDGFQNAHEIHAEHAEKLKRLFVKVLLTRYRALFGPHDEDTDRDFGSQGGFFRFCEETLVRGLLARAVAALLRALAAEGPALSAARMAA